MQSLGSPDNDTLTLRKAAVVPKVPLLGQTGRGHSVAHHGGLLQPQQRDVVSSVRGVIVGMQVFGLDHNRLFPSLALVLSMAMVILFVTLVCIILSNLAIMLTKNSHIAKVFTYNFSLGLAV